MNDPQPYRVRTVSANGNRYELQLDKNVDVPGSEPALLWLDRDHTWLHWRGIDIRVDGMNIWTNDPSAFDSVDITLTFTLE